ncbi:hypothetical protein [Chromobacterium amazonense]|uniref:hypothetical protein n=1 Tax=Chromobacterium amazonense TaxID=1382803 RepID=UPI0011B1FC1A|nr:hypothetical protein [Chromobacterium amazonense]
MEKTSIKEISPRAIEKAFANALQELTGKEWSITINDLNFVLHSDVLSIRPSTESITMSVHAGETFPPFEKDPSIPF